MNNEYLSYLSEIGQIRSILAMIPEDHVLERESFEERLELAQKALKPLSPEDPNIKLTFSGQPVMEQKGIYTDFAAMAWELFTKAYNQISTTLKKEPKDQTKFAIVGAGAKSFGFQLSLLPTEENLSNNLSPAPIEQMSKLLEAAHKGSDADLAEIITTLEPSAIGSIFAFMDYLLRKKATFSLKHDKCSFKITDIKELEKATNRLKQDNIKESVANYTGEFQGILPEKKAFEFKCSDNNTIVYDKIYPSIPDPGILNAEYLNKKNTKSPLKPFKLEMENPVTFW
jgi:hypothetical protein